MNYLRLTDDKLISKIKKGDNQAEIVLYTRYKIESIKLGKAFFKEFKSYGITLDEFISVCYASVFIAIRKYDVIQVSFHQYWYATAKNEVFTYVRQNKSLFANKCRVSFDDYVFSDNDEITLHERFASPSEEDNSLEENIAAYIYSPTSNLTDSEALVAHYLFFRHYSYKEIMEKTGWTRSKTFYVINCTRQKISVYLKNGYFK